MTAVYEMAAAKWPMLVAMLILFGTSAFALASAPPASNDDAGALELLASLWRWLALANLVLSPIELIVATANAAAVPMREALPYLGQVLVATHMGRLWLWRLPISVAILAAAVAHVTPRTRAASIFLLSAALLGIRALGGHAIEQGTAAIVAYAAHELAAGAWLGALVVLALAAAAGGPARERIAVMGARVSRVAGWSVAALAASGLYNAWCALGLRPDLLVDSLYGRTLLWKLGTTAPVLVLAGYNRWRLLPAADDFSAQAMLVRNVAVEVALLGAVLGWSAVLANSPPPH